MTCSRRANSGRTVGCDVYSSPATLVTLPAVITARNTSICLCVSAIDYMQNEWDADLQASDWIACPDPLST